ncbi:hypothetical protein ACFQ9X_37535 [Catenulispora yoronensis]
MAINNNNEIIGTADGQAFFWAAGTMTNLGTLGEPVSRPRRSTTSARSSATARPPGR